MYRPYSVDVPAYYSHTGSIPQMAVMEKGGIGRIDCKSAAWYISDKVNNAMHVYLTIGGIAANKKRLGE